MPPHSSSHHPLRIVPKELVFPAPLNRVITNILKLQNVTQNFIAYKVKTTAPQRYCVRPNNGVLPPGETIEVQVLLNYVKDAPPNLDIKDKFQIQSIVLHAPLTNPADVSEVWAKATNEQITKQKLKSRFTAATSKPPAPLSNAQSQQDLTSHEPAPPPQVAEPQLSSSNLQTSSSLSTSSSTQTTPPSSTISHSQSTPSFQQSSVQQLATSQSSPLPVDKRGISSSSSSLSSSQSSIISQSVPPSIQHQSSVQLSTSKSSPQPVDKRGISFVDSSSQLKPNLAPQKPLGESADIYSTPVISSITSQEVKDIPLLDPRTPIPKSDSSYVVHDNVTPTPTGDYVVDTVANFTKLRQTLEQVALLKSEKEGVLKENQKLNDQVKMLVDQMQRAKEEHQVGLRQRTVHSSPTPAGPPLFSTRPDSQSQQMLIQIQTRVLLFVILFFAIIGFLLGRYSR